MRNCEETVFSITRFENRVQTALTFNFSGKIFSLYFLADWSLTFAALMLFRSVLRTEDALPIVVIDLQAIFMTGHNSGIPFPECSKISTSENSPIIHEYFHVSKYAAWSLTVATQMLLRRSGSELFDRFTNIILLKIFPPQNISTIKYLFVKNASKTKMTNCRRTSRGPV